MIENPFAALAAGAKNEPEYQDKNI